MIFAYADVDADIAGFSALAPSDSYTNVFDQITPPIAGSMSGTVRWVSNTLAGNESSSVTCRATDSQSRTGDGTFNLVTLHAAGTTIGIDVDQDTYTINNGESVSPTGTWGAHAATIQPSLSSFRTDGQPVSDATIVSGLTAGDWTQGPLTGLGTGSHAITTQITHPNSGLVASVNYTVVVVAVGAPPIVSWDLPSVLAQEGDATVTLDGTFEDADADIVTLAVASTGDRDGGLAHGSLAVTGPAAFTWTLANPVQIDSGSVTVTATDANGNNHQATMVLTVTQPATISICDVVPAPTAYLVVGGVTGPNAAEINGTYTFEGISGPATETGLDCEKDATRDAERFLVLGFSDTTVRWQHRYFVPGGFDIIAFGQTSYTDYPWYGIKLPTTIGTSGSLDSNNNDWASAVVTLHYPNPPAAYAPAGMLLYDFDKTTFPSDAKAAWEAWRDSLGTDPATGRAFVTTPTNPGPWGSWPYQIRHNQDELPVLLEDHVLEAEAFLNRKPGEVHHQWSMHSFLGNIGGYWFPWGSDFEWITELEFPSSDAIYDLFDDNAFGITHQGHPGSFGIGFGSKVAPLNHYIAKNPVTGNPCLNLRLQVENDVNNPTDYTTPINFYGPDITQGAKQVARTRFNYDPSGNTSYAAFFVDDQLIGETTARWGRNFSSIGGVNAPFLWLLFGGYMSGDFAVLDGGVEPKILTHSSKVYSGWEASGLVTANDILIPSARFNQGSSVNLVTAPGNQNINVGDTTIEHLASSRMRDAQVVITQATGDVTITPDVRDTGRKVAARFKVTNNTSGLSDIATVEVTTMSKPMYQFISVKSQADLANILDPVGNGFPADTELWAMSHQGFNDFGLFDKTPGESNAGWIEAVAAAGRPMFLSFQPGVDWTNWSLAQTASPPASPTLQPGLASYMEGLPQATKDLIIGIQIEHAVASGGTPESVNLGNATQVVQDAIPSLANKISAYNINPPKPNGDRLTYFTKLGYQLQPSATTGRKQYQFALTHEASVDTHLNNRPGGNVYQVNPNGFNGFIWNGLGGQEIGTATPDVWDNAYRRIIHEPYAQTLRRLTLQHQIGMLGVILFTFQFSRFADITVDDETPLVLENMLDHRLSQWNETIKAYNDYSNGTLSGNMVNVDQGDFIQDIYSHGSA